MQSFLNKDFDYKTAIIANAVDELSVWSTAFGSILLENIPLGDYSNYLDIGCGTGFPLIPVAQRIGPQCRATGIDPWSEAINRATAKVKALELTNINLIEADASVIDYPNDYFDLITSSLGINNFENPLTVLKECYRVIKPNAYFCITTNLAGTFEEFYHMFNVTINELGLPQYQKVLTEHIEHRGTENSTIDLLEAAGFKIKRTIFKQSKLRFLNGTAFLNDFTTIIGFMQAWKKIIPSKDHPIFFTKLEQNLNKFSLHNGELKLNVPIFYAECIKIK